jgi:hypothetical protein
MPSRFILPREEYDALKVKVASRDSNRCRCCGSKKMVSGHHIVFRSEGGGDFSSNLVSLCGDKCHLAVHGRLPNLFIQILAGDGNEDTLPDADYGLKFKKYSKVRRRIRWRFPRK